MKLINLLPKNRQNEVRLEDQYKLILKFFLISMSGFTVTILCLIGFRVYLADQSRRITSDIQYLKNAVNKQENSELKAEIQKINSQIKDFQTLSETTPSWSNVLLAFGKLVPDGVDLNSFTADTQRNHVEIRGFAETRSQVLELYKNLSSDTKHFKDVSFPLENISKPEEVSFNFSFTILPETLLP